MNNPFRFIILLSLASLFVSFLSAESIKVLLVDGQNNHNWKATTPVLKQALQSSGRFSVTVSTSPARNGSKDDWAQWNPEFGSFDVTLSNYNGQTWPESVQKGLEDYVKGGGARQCN